jgi:replication-associated recombination protein RarA
MKNEIQKTAVELYHQQIVDRQNGNGDSRNIDEIFEQAKEMEKKQHKQTWLDSTAQFDNAAAMTYKKDFEQYYNETFNTNEK